MIYCRTDELTTSPLKFFLAFLSAALKFDEFCNRKFDNLFSTGYVERPRYTFIILRSWMIKVILDFSVTQAKSQSHLFLFC